LVHIGGNDGREVVVVVVDGSHIFGILVSAVQMFGCSSLGGAELQGPGVLLSVAGVGRMVIVQVLWVQASLHCRAWERVQLWISQWYNFWDW